jgi:hypothetical protein
MPPALQPTRLFWLALTWAAIGLAGLGAVLPMMPTTVFLLIALWTGSKASPRFRFWLLRHPRYGPVLRDWHRHGVISRPAQWLATGMMALSVGILWLAGASASVLIAVGACLALIAVYILTRPSRVDADRRR